MKTSFLIIFTFIFFQRSFGSTRNTTSSNATCIETERRSLLIFKQTVTDQYNLLSTWKGVDCCAWQGVVCDNRNGHVEKLDLRVHVPPNETMVYNDKSLKGELSPSLQNLRRLRYLDLSMNDFSGNIPEFLGSFKRLEYLNLSHSGLAGVVPHHLGNLSRLQYLDLRSYFVLENTYGYDTSITRIKFSNSPIVDNLGWISSLSSLRHFDLSGVNIGNQINWLKQVNMLSSLLTLNLACSDINIPSNHFVNFTSLTSLDLSVNAINSTIPLWLSNLTSLSHLNLNSNDLFGEIPDVLGRCSVLSFIDFSSNSLRTLTPNLLCNLSSLVHLDLTSNRFDTRIHDVLCNSSNLGYLDLSWNMFFGPIPSNIVLHLRLENLYLHYNQLSGNIPISLGELSNLKNLDLSHNSFVGDLYEAHFIKLKNLKRLTLSSNPLALSFTSRWVPPFQLQAFSASSCIVGPHFPNWLQTQTNLRILDISNSSIRDTRPEWFENTVSRTSYLDVSNNQIAGKLPQLLDDGSNQTWDRILKLNSNKFEGSLVTFPSNVKVLDLSDNLLSGHVPETDGTINPSLEVINLSKNRFTGSILVHSCKFPSLRVLDLSQNKFSGRLPACLGNLTNMNVLDLSNNTLNGVVPPSLGSIKYLTSLNLQHNKFEGNIPSSLQNLRDLFTMNLGNNMFMGTIPLWIGEKLHYLRILDLQSNTFTGEIPLQLCQLKDLHYLSLAHNNITGTIPRCLGNISGMIVSSLGYATDPRYYEEKVLVSTKGRQLWYTKIILYLVSLDLSSNNIVGEIPDALMSLAAIKNLNLSSNLLKGEIPNIIGDLKQLESLDLSMNKLSGRIPQSLTRLNFLSYLNLSFNNLSGAIPVGTQLQTLVDPSIYEGNNGLCGPPVSKSCNENDGTYNRVSVSEGQNDNERLWFYVGMGLGFVVGFVGLLGSLHFSRTWRVTYFRTLGRVYDWLILSVLLNFTRLKRKVFECFRKNNNY